MSPAQMTRRAKGAIARGRRTTTSGAPGTGKSQHVIHVSAKGYAKVDRADDQQVADQISAMLRANKA